MQIRSVCIHTRNVVTLICYEQMGLVTDCFEYNVFYLFIIILLKVYKGNSYSNKLQEAGFARVAVKFVLPGPRLERILLSGANYQINNPICS